MDKQCWKSSVTSTKADTVKKYHNNIITVFVILTLLEASFAFNIAPKATHIASKPLSQGEKSVQGEPYFGYSVGILDNDEGTWLLVGAPKANSTGSPEVFEPGALFKCPVKSIFYNKCEEIILDTSRNFQKVYEPPRIPLRDSGWTGAALDIDEEGNVIVCAPRWKNIPTQRGSNRKLKEYRINGFCYIIGKDLKSNTAYPFSPMLDRNNQIYSYLNTGVYHHAHAECGFAVHVTKSSDLLLGSPGVMNWQGSVAKYRPQLNVPVPGGGRSRRDISIFYQSILVPNTIHTTSIHDSNFFGYSVTSGKFDSDFDLYYVAGAPRASGFGKVFVFLMRTYSSQNLFIKDTKQGIQMGEYFGTSVAAPDLNGDGLSDLVAGAPLHSAENQYDVGCVYVYMNNDRESGQLAIDGIQLFGDIQSRARFGTSLGTPGDLDRDGYEDLVVGAPYENDGAGAVYVFMGSMNGIRKQFSQKLTSEKVYPEGLLKGLGISFSRPRDVDENSYPDFAIGAFLSDNVVLMQTRPVIKAKGEILSEPQRLSFSDKNFVALPCIHYEGYGVPLHTVFEAKVSLQQESASGEVIASFRDTGSTEKTVNITGYKSERMCVNLNVAVKLARSNANPITIRMDFKIKDGAVAPESPILSPYSEPPAPLQLSFITGCSDDICISDLVTFAKFQGFDSKGILLVGDLDKLTLEVRVRNRNDPAFLPNINITVPRPMLVLPSMHDCTVIPLILHEEVVCQLMNPLRKSEKDVVLLDLDITLLDDTSPDIQVKLYSDSAADEELKPDDNKFELSLNVRKEASLRVTGWSKPEHFHYERKSENELTTNETIKIEHVFSIEKSGKTPLKDVSIRVVIPTAFTSSTGSKLKLLLITENELTFHGKSHTCVELQQTKEENRTFETKKEHEMSFNEYGSDESSYLPTTWNCSLPNIHCTSVECNIGPWKKAYDVATLKVLVQLNFSDLGHLIPVKDGFVVGSFVEVKIPNAEENDVKGETYRNAAVRTMFFPGSVPAQPLPIWIYLLAVLGGLLLLIIIAFILYKVGFFRRKKYEELQAQQARVTSQEDRPALH